MYHIKPVISLEPFRIVRHSYAVSLSTKVCLDKINNIFNSKTKVIYLNPLIVYKSKLKIKVMSPWKFFLIMLTSAVICKQRRLHENEIEQLLHN